MDVEAEVLEDGYAHGWFCNVNDEIAFYYEAFMIIFIRFGSELKFQNFKT